MKLELFFIFIKKNYNLILVRFFFTVVFLFIFNLIECQSLKLNGTFFLKNNTNYEIPFDIINNLIVINIEFNSQIPLKFIFDTGAENSILCKKEIATSLGLNYDRKVELLGSDLSRNLSAYVSKNVLFTYPKDGFTICDILILDEDYLKFENMLGEPIAGIIGIDVFRDYIFQINYDKKVIILYNRKKNDLNIKNYDKIPIQVFHNKPYIKILSQINKNGIVDSLNFLMDTGASVSLLYYLQTVEKDKLPFKIINGNFGAGLGGFLKGYIGRVNSVTIGKSELFNILTNFQIFDTLPENFKKYNRNGILGNELLSRFNTIYDLENNAVYMKPNKLFKRKFDFDKSGLHIIASGTRLNHYLVDNVIEHSAAEIAGIRVGDEIVKIGFWGSMFYSLDKIYSIFQKKADRKIRITIKRGEIRLKKVITLKELI
jgi:Aspartyl protease/PDZ domain